jgi:hypothetical protein
VWCVSGVWRACVEDGTLEEWYVCIWVREYVKSVCPSGPRG